MSYGNAGVAKQGVNKADHGIVYIGQAAPVPQPGELPQRGETGMVPIAIRIVPDDATERLFPSSRIHYGKISTIEHNVKARSVGMVHESSLADFLAQNREVLSRA